MFTCCLFLSEHTMEDLKFYTTANKTPPKKGLCLKNALRLNKYLWLKNGLHLEKGLKYGST